MAAMDNCFEVVFDNGDSYTYAWFLLPAACRGALIPYTLCQNPRVPCMFVSPLCLTTSPPSIAPLYVLYPLPAA